MRGSFKPLYLPSRRKGIAPLSPPQVHQTLRMDGCCHGWTRRNKGHIGNKSGPGRAQLGRTNVIIYCDNTSSCKRGAHRRTRNRRTQIPPSKTNLLRVHCPHSMQVTVPALSKYCVRGIYGIREATTLLSRVFDNSGLRSNSQRHYKQPRCDGQDCKMGY